MSGPSPERRAILYLEDVLKFAHYAIQFLGDQSNEQVENDLQAQFAIVRAVEVIGEAASQIPVDIRDLAPEVPWRDIVAMRNRIIHHYFGVHLDIVLNVVRQDLAPLIESVEHLLSELRASQE